MYMYFKTVIIPIVLMPVFMSFQSACDFKRAAHSLIDNGELDLRHIFPFPFIVISD